MSDSVHVVCRFRPPMSSDLQSKVVAKISDDEVGCTVKTGKDKKTFNFDRCFHWQTSQGDVYRYSGEPLVQQVLRGFNCTIFAYGQTGSGKTFTMEGEPRNPGIIPRMVEHLFDSILEFDERVEFILRVSYIEIYNEKIRDLLQPSNSNLRVRENQQGVYVESCANPFCGSPEEILGYLSQGHSIRSCASTKMNNQSSRSHAVFMLMISQRNVDTDSKKMSKLFLVDLAGSEKVRKTGATGSTLKEAQNINRSLACLGLVINSLTEGKKSHIPYRDSKLTRLLSDSLGGNSKTCIIVTASPCEYNLDETISTLRFGTRCKRVKNKPKINEELSVAEYRAKVQSLERRCQKLEKLVLQLESQVRQLKARLQQNGIQTDDILENFLTAEVAVGGGDPEATEKLERQIIELENQHAQFEELIIDLKSELQDAEVGKSLEEEQKQVFQSQVEQMGIENKKQISKRDEKILFYKEKLDRIDQDSKMEILKLQQAVRRLEMEAEDMGGGAVESSESVKSLSEDDADSAPAADTLKVKQMQMKNLELQEKLETLKKREGFNDKLRRNWQQQIRQMEQALVLSNQINTQNRNKYQNAIKDKENQILELKNYINHQVQRQRALRRGRIAQPIVRRPKKDDSSKPPDSTSYSFQDTVELVSE